MRQQNCFFFLWIGTWEKCENHALRNCNSKEHCSQEMTRKINWGNLHISVCDMKGKKKTLCPLLMKTYIFFCKNHSISFCKIIFSGLDVVYSYFHCSSSHSRKQLFIQVQVPLPTTSLFHQQYSNNYHFHTISFISIPRIYSFTTPSAL